MSEDLKKHLKELGEVSGKIFQDIKKSVTSMINDYKEKQAAKKSQDAVQETHENKRTKETVEPVAPVEPSVEEVEAAKATKTAKKAKTTKVADDPGVSGEDKVEPKE